MKACIKSLGRLATAAGIAVSFFWPAAAAQEQTAASVEGFAPPVLVGNNSLRPGVDLVQPTELVPAEFGGQSIGIEGGAAREVEDLPTAPRRAGGIKLHIDVDKDLKTLTYSKVMDDSGVFGPGGAANYEKLKLRPIARFPSFHLISPEKYIKQGLWGRAGGDLQRLWDEQARYTRYGGITTTWDAAVDQGVWTTNIDTVILHKRLEESGLLRDRQLKRAAEIGVGGGHVAAMLAARIGSLKELSITDINPAALKMAKGNIRGYLHGGAMLRTYLGRGTEALDPNIDLLAMNPPYIPSKRRLPANPYEGTDLIEDALEKGIQKLNAANPQASIVMVLSSVTGKSFNEMLSRLGPRVIVEKIGEAVRAPLKIYSMSETWLESLLADGGLELLQKHAPWEERYWHEIQVYRIRRKS